MTVYKVTTTDKEIYVKARSIYDAMELVYKKGIQILTITIMPRR